MIPVLFAVSTIVFFLIHAIPGDPVDLIAGDRALPMDRVMLAHDLHLDEPVYKQYGRFIGGLMSGDWGKSLYDSRPVLSHIKDKFGSTFILALCAMAIAIGIALPAGIISSIRRGSGFDQGAMFLSLIGISVPAFWLGPVLILIFSVKLGVLPISGRESLVSLILPSITLGAALAAMLSRLTRSSMLEEIRREYVTTARAKGLSERSVIFKHALKNALNPIITIIGLQTAALLAGTVITEKIFSWPGVGMLLMDSIGRRDYPLVQGCILVISFAYVIVNTITDCLYSVVDPRVRL
jgi:peptide/nickel transport system permease protein